MNIKELSIEDAISKIKELENKNAELENQNKLLMRNNKKLNLTIDEANQEAKRESKLLNMYIDRKNAFFNETQPKSPKIEKDAGGKPTREDKFYKYVYKCTKEDIDWWIDKLNDDVNILNDYIDDELNRLGELDIIKQKIYDLRNDKEYIKKHGGKKREWWKVAEGVGFSERHTRRLYKSLIGKRTID